MFYICILITKHFQPYLKWPTWQDQSYLAEHRQRQWDMSSFQRSSSHMLSPCILLLWKKICTDKTSSPETAGNSKFTHLNGTIPRTVHVHKSKSTKATQAKQSKQTEEPVVPKIKWNTDSIELNGKMHKLPITKDYILKEYSEVFKGVGTLPGGPYHIRLKEQYRPVQHPPRSVPVAM